MKQLAILGILLTLGCAKFPDAGGGNQVARVHFKMVVEGRLNTVLNNPTGGGYVYAVALRAITATNTDPNKDPVPILAANVNGIVAGEPTHIVELASPGTSIGQPFQLLKFNRLGGSTPELDLASQVNLSVLPQAVQSGILNVTFTQITPDSRIMEFDINLTDLTDGNLTLAQQLTFLQINFLTRVALFTPGTGSTPFDAIGNTASVGGLNQAVSLNLRGNNIVRLSSLDTTDEFNDVHSVPDINITDWSAQVIQP